MIHKYLDFLEEWVTIAVVAAVNPKIVVIYQIAPVLQRLPLAHEFFLNYLRKVRFIIFIFTGK